MRRLALAAALACAATAPLGACRGRAGGPLRLGYFPNVTHAQALVGLRQGAFAAALGGRVEALAFRAGPAAMEALLAGDVDVCYVGPGPAAIAYLRSGGEALRVIAGAVSGGAVLVARSARSPRDLEGKAVATPQLGNTQDIALRTWLRRSGIRVDAPGGVAVKPLPNADILSFFERGDLEAAWVPEPWGARLLAEASGRILLDERDLWEGRRFPTALVAASARALRERRPEVLAVLRAHLALTERGRADARGFARAANLEYGAITGHPLPESTLDDAFSRLELTADPMAAQVVKGAKEAQDLGFAPPGDLSRLVDPMPLREVGLAGAGG